MATQLITVQHINTIRTVDGRGGKNIRVRMLTIDGNENRKAYLVSPEIADEAMTELHQSPARPSSITIEIEGRGRNAQVVNYYR